MLTLALLAAASISTPDLRSTFDLTPTKTGRYAESVKLCRGYEAAFPAKVRCEAFGVTPEGRPMVALIVSGDGTLDAASAKTKKRPVVLFQGGIHAGEIDGKDAGFQIVHEALADRGKKRTGDEETLGAAISKVTLVFVPVFNVDGHERMSKFQRPNQRGPEEQGWRVTAQNLNLNRDYAKADAPEMRAMLSLLSEWDPAIYLDLHVTDGAKFQHDVSVLVAPLEGDAGVVKLAAALRAECDAEMRKRKHLVITDFYPAFEKDTDPLSGFAIGDPPIRFSQAYWSSRNRLGILVETHSWKDYAVRVRATHDTLVTVIDSAARNGAAWLDAEAKADDASRAIAGKPVTLAWDNGKHARTIDFLGYVYSVTTSGISGAAAIHYDETKPQVWKCPLADTLEPVFTLPAPKSGYVITAGYAPLVEDRLRAHGIEYSKLLDAKASRAVQSFRAIRAEPSKATFEGRTRLTLEGQWSPDSRALPAGSIFVPIAQAKSTLVMQLLEPAAPDSFGSWGFFNAAFEQKEYMEPYVAEDLAKQMLAKDATLKSEFEKKLAEDKAFASDPHARLDFFYKRSPYWDERMDLYPVYRMDEAP